MTHSNGTIGHDALLVCNRDPLRRMLQDWLETAGYAVTVSSSGRDGLSHARRNLPALVVADIELPDLSAAELCQALRSDGLVSPGVPVLVASRDEVPRDRRLSILRAGAWECLVWPWDPEAVLLRLRAYSDARLAIERARADGLVDPVTGLYNSRGLARRAREMGSHAFRHHEPLACVMLSIDVSPDAPAVPVSALLAPVAVALQASARPSDPMGRVTGAEFALFAAGADQKGALQMAQRLRRAVQSVAEVAGLPAGSYRVDAAVDAVANLTYSPVEPTDLMSRATTALRENRSRN